MKSNFEFTESGLIFSIKDRETMRKFKYTAEDFSSHGEAFKWLKKYVDTEGKFPSIDMIRTVQPTLDSSASDAGFKYCYDEFKEQVQWRRLMEIHQGTKDLMGENTREYLNKLLPALNRLIVTSSDDVTPYDDGLTDRYDEWQDRRNLREKSKEGIVGVKTQFKIVNKTGIGWMGGNLISLFARPTVGKTWLCVDAAVTAAMAGNRTLLISTEISKHDMNLRSDVVTAQRMGFEFSHTDLRTGNPINEKEYIKFLKKNKSQNSLICDRISGKDGMSIDDISGLVTQHKPQFLVIDGVYLIGSSNSKKGSAMWEQSHSLFYGLKSLALARDIPVFVTTQANRDADNLYVTPKADQVAFGDALIRASDTVLGVAMVEGNKNQRILQIEKYREGANPADKIYMHFDVDKGKIFEEEGTGFDINWADIK